MNSQFPVSINIVNFINFIFSLLIKMIIIIITNLDIIKLQANNIQIEENDIHPINDFFKCNKNYKTKKYLII